MRVIGVLLAIVCLPALAEAQTTLPSWDLALGIGSFSGHPTPDPGAVNSYDNWYQTGEVSVSAGRYLTQHLKTEIEFAATGEDSNRVFRYVTVPGTTTAYPFATERFYRTRSVSAAIGWQFGENRWVHPYLMTGVAVDFLRTRAHTTEQFTYVGSPAVSTRVIAERFDPPKTESHARGWVSGGAKFYALSRLFVRSELRVGFSNRVEHVGIRIGLGIDF